METLASELQGMNVGVSVFFPGPASTNLRVPFAPRIAQRGDATRSDLAAIRRYQCVS